MYLCTFWVHPPYPSGPLQCYFIHQSFLAPCPVPAYPVYWTCFWHLMCQPPALTCLTLSLILCPCQCPVTPLVETPLSNTSKLPTGILFLLQFRSSLLYRSPQPQKRLQQPKYLNPYRLHQLFIHTFTYPIVLFLPIPAYGTGCNLVLTILEVRHEILEKLSGAGNISGVK